jgi:hypothetical protein
MLWRPALCVERTALGMDVVPEVKKIRPSDSGVVLMPSPATMLWMTLASPFLLGYSLTAARTAGERCCTLERQ